MSDLVITGVRKYFGSKWFTVFLKGYPEKKTTFKHYMLEKLESEELWNYILNHGYIGMVITFDSHGDPVSLRRPNGFKELDALSQELDALLQEHDPDYRGEA